MLAAVLDEEEGTRRVSVRDVPEPVRAASEVTVAVRAATLNRVDLYMRGGGAGITHTLPIVVGLDCAGVVAEVGPEETLLKPGDRVLAYPSLWCGRCEFCLAGEPVLCARVRIRGEHIDGILAERVTFPGANLFRVPDALSFEEAAALPTAYLTAWRMVSTKGWVRPTDTVLIFGIGGGVSLAAMQMCKALGARTIVTSGSDDKLERARALGADVTINHRSADVVRAVMAATGGRGADVVIENVGKATWAWAMRSVVRGGRIVVCGATSGSGPAMDLQRLFIRQIQVIGTTLANPGELAELLAFIDRTGLRPVIDRRFALAETPAALDHLDAGNQFGKVAIMVSE
ncbi:zinc-binding dehydrogenase [Azospirillum sp. RWY-5-1]|uniref:Zinc-binding dehydrogenase n=1 Tax=Azospirillum oleiclasticum TaxID=2735135 RepID=A0ABX2TI91_9PROT|nr:zinc-binding dehydrogenase [Azospirillum oleiclasticum]NYZ16469.1 zinc-binding dehydrogenase [Azospirillum oleiclasticum]NYZ24062.1 zinc-binding dehydrogenase [Azospirillum oleiclasticum]